MRTLWNSRYAQRTQRMKSSAIREMFKITEKPGVISFGGGLPAPDSFPLGRFKESCQRVLDTTGPKSLQYGPTEGFSELREWIASETRKQGINATVGNVMITSGSQQALDLIGKVFVNPGDRILVETPAYLGALQAWDAYGAEYVTVPSDENGMITESLEAVLRTGPKFIYVLPNFHNPAGVTLSLERRKQLVMLANRYGVPIIEDDPYRQLRFEGEDLPSLALLDSLYDEDCMDCYSGNVIYLSTFSKIISPGIRLAWVIAPEDVITKMVIAKQGADLHTSTFSQMVAYDIARGGFLDEHVKTIRKLYHERRDTMLAALDACFPSNVDWTYPQGGLFLWCTLPEDWDAEVLLPKAVERKVAYVPGVPFYPYSEKRNNMRLNFSYSNPAEIREGIARLGELLKEQ